MSASAETVRSALREFFEAKESYQAEFLLLQAGDAARRLTAARKHLEELRIGFVARPGLTEDADSYEVRNLVNYFGAELFTTPQEVS